MSYILDALKKSDQERKLGEVPTITSADSTVESGESAPKGIGIKVAAGGLALVGVVLVGIFFLSGDDEAPAPAKTEMAMTPSAPEQSPEPEPEPELKIIEKPKIVSTPSTVKKPKITQSIVATAPVDANIPKPQQSATEAPPPASQPIDSVSKAPAPKNVPGSTIATGVTTKPQIKTAIAPVREKPKSNLPELKQASDYLDRGWSSMDRGLYNQAVSDFYLAVEMEPGFNDGWFALGWAQEKNEQDSYAIASYTRAIKAKPNHTGALFSRAYLELFSGNASAAVRDFTATTNIANGDLKMYANIWLFIARSNAGMDATGNLAAYGRDADLSVWPGAIVKFYANNLGEAEVLQSIESGNVSNLQERRCAGYFFLGEHALIKGNTAKAKGYFEKALATGAANLRQFDGARRELSKLAK